MDNVEVGRKDQEVFQLDIIIILLLLAAVIGIPYVIIKRKKELKELGALKEFIGNHEGGIPFINQGAMVSVLLYPDKITVGNKYTIPFKDIKNLNVCTEKEIKEKSRSVIGRGLVGGALLGPAGAIVGGMSGVKNKQTTKETYYLVIDYQDPDGPASAKFTTGNYMAANSFSQAAVKQMQA